MYIISLSETWHPFIHFLEKNNLSGFFVEKLFWSPRVYASSFGYGSGKGHFLPNVPEHLGLGNDLLTRWPKLESWFARVIWSIISSFFLSCYPPPLFIIGHCDKSRKHGKISIALPWLQVQSQFSLKPSLKAEFLVLVATFGNPHHGSNQTKFPVVRKHTIFLKMKSMSMYIMTIMSRSMMIYLENVREPTYSRFDD